MFWQISKIQVFFSEEWCPEWGRRRRQRRKEVVPVAAEPPPPPIPATGTTVERPPLVQLPQFEVLGSTDGLSTLPGRCNFPRCWFPMSLASPGTSIEEELRVLEVSITLFDVWRWWWPGDRLLLLLLLPSWFSSNFESCKNSGRSQLWWWDFCTKFCSGLVNNDLFSCCCRCLLVTSFPGLNPAEISEGGGIGLLKLLLTCAGSDRKLFPGVTFRSPSRGATNCSSCCTDWAALQWCWRWRWCSSSQIWPDVIRWCFVECNFMWFKLTLLPLSPPPSPPPSGSSKSGSP